MRTLAYFSFASSLLVLGCGNDTNSMMDMAPPAPPLGICSPMIPAGAMPSTMHVNAPNPVPADFAMCGACTEATSAITSELADDVVTADLKLTPLGKAVKFAGGTGPYPHNIDFVIPADLGKAPANAPSSDIVVVEKRPNGATVVTPVSNIIYEGGYKLLHFHGDELATYQAAIPVDAGTMTTRHYTFRAIGGVSMGGIGSSINFWKHPELYDAIAVMGADPGPDLTYILGVTHDWFFGGFCTVADEKAGNGKVGMLCPSKRKPLADQMEESFDFEHFNYQAGEGVGLTLKRGLFIRAFRDLSRAYGNAAYATAMGTSTYVPPGVDISVTTVDNNTFCTKPTVLKNFFDANYNPDGAHDVISFCDGGDDPNHYGVFDGTQPQTDPTQILLAVDVNGNGKRDSGEPVLLQGSEHFSDVGTDGKADADEPGYDAVNNPDPNHDDFHWLHNPSGTENNWRYDMGEPFDDFGVDGVQGKGCAVGSSAGCYDFGEGNGKFDYAPNVANWLAHDPRVNIETVSDDQLKRVDVYYDAGIRDFFNAQVSTNSLMAALHKRGQHIRVWDGFPVLTGNRQAEETKFEVTAVDFSRIGRHGYVRYGNPDLTEAQVESTGDGRHVGTVLQAVHRAQMLFYFLDTVFPGGDRDQNFMTTPDLVNGMFVAKDGRMTPYLVVLPPGYDDPGSASKTYPVVYFMHGYGMTVQDLGSISAATTSAMANNTKPMQKFILVFVDGRCAPGGDINGGPLPPDGDLCEEGTFYGEHPDGLAKAESQLLELQAIIDGKYRVKAAADVPVMQ
jgi:hypothetical protein